MGGNLFPDPWYDLGFHLCINNINCPVNGVGGGARVIGQGFEHSNILLPCTVGAGRSHHGR